MASVRKGDVNTKFSVTVLDEYGEIIPLTSFIEVKIILEAPRGEIKVKDGLFETDGSDGKIYCNSEAGDIDETGEWEIQVWASSNTDTFSTSIGKFEVLKSLYPG